MLPVAFTSVRYVSPVWEAQTPAVSREPPHSCTVQFTKLTVALAVAAAVYGGQLLEEVGSDCGGALGEGGRRGDGEGVFGCDAADDDDENGGDSDDVDDDDVGVGDDIDDVVASLLLPCSCSSERSPRSSAVSPSKEVRSSGRSASSGNRHDTDKRYRKADSRQMTSSPRHAGARVAVNRDEHARQKNERSACGRDDAPEVLATDWFIVGEGGGSG